MSAEVQSKIHDKGVDFADMDDAVNAFLHLAVSHVNGECWACES